MPGLDQRGHQRQLRREPALLRLAGHPGGDLLARRVVARVGVRRRGGDGGGVDHAARRGAPAGAADGLRRRGGRGRGGARLRRLDGLQERLRVARALACASAAAALAVTAFRNICESRRADRRRRGRGRRGDRGRARRRDRGGDRRAATGGRAAGAAAATSAGGFQSAVIACLKPMWRWFWWAASVK